MIVIKNEQISPEITQFVCSILIFVTASVCAIAQNERDIKESSAKAINAVYLRINDPISKDHIPVNITYVNSDSINKQFMQPPKNKQGMKKFDFFEIKFDEKKPSPILPAMDRDSLEYGEFHGWLSKNIINLKPKTSYSFTIPVENVYQIPDQWSTCTIKVYRKKGDRYQYTGEIKIKKLKKHEYISVTKNPVVQGVEKKTKPQIDCSFQLTNQIPSQNSIQFNLKFKNPSEIADAKNGLVKIPLNKRNLVKNMSIDIDGKPAKKKETQEDKENQKLVTLKVNQSHNITMDLNKWFKIPEKWKKIDIKLKRFHPALYKTDTLTIKRIQKESGKKKKKKKSK